MNRSILTADHAEDLNQLVQEKIDPRLYLLCNYEPTIRHAISEDGRYLLNIQDLYKFAIDSCAVIKQYYDIVPKREKNRPEFKRLEILQSQISNFRTVFDHNTSEKDGRSSADTMAAYKVWVRAIIGKSAPDTADDFKRLNEKLKEMADELRHCFETFVRCAAEHPKKDEVVNKWIDKTLYWYSNNTKTNIYKGQLIDAYIARAVQCNANIDDEKWRSFLPINIKQWIFDAQIHQLKSKISQIEEEICTFRNVLEGKDPRIHLPPTAVEQRNQLRKSLDEKEQALPGLQSELKQLERWKELDPKEREKLDPKEREKSDPKEREKHFYRNLEKQLRETMKYLDENGESYTLLPQDLMQLDIERMFGKVPTQQENFFRGKSF